jgi:hypothetical protein
MAKNQCWMMFFEFEIELPFEVFSLYDFFFPYYTTKNLLVVVALERRIPKERNLLIELDFRH